MRLVLDSSVLIAAVRPSEAGHSDALEFVERLRDMRVASDVELFAPPELWLEVHVVEQRFANARRNPGPPAGSAMKGLAITLVGGDDADALQAFLSLLTKQMRGRRPFANATDLVYLWAAQRIGATVVTLDHGMLGYHGLVCDVTRPEHVRFG